MNSKFLRLLKALPHLATLDFTNSNLTDDGLLELDGLTGLTTLGVDSTQVTDVGLKVIGKLTQLMTLDLSATNITWMRAYSNWMASRCLARLNSQLQQNHGCGTAGESRAYRT